MNNAIKNPCEFAKSASIRVSFAVGFSFEPNADCRVTLQNTLSESIKMVTGPSFTSETCIIA